MNGPEDVDSLTVFPERDSFCPAQQHTNAASAAARLAVAAPDMAAVAGAVRGTQPAVSMSAAGIYCREVLTRKTKKTQ